MSEREYRANKLARDPIPAPLTSEDRAIFLRDPTTTSYSMRVGDRSDAEIMFARVDSSGVTPGAEKEENSKDRGA